MTKKALAVTSVSLSLGLSSGAEFPSAAISNGDVQAKICLPNAKEGYYRGTRFDWSGVVYSLKYKGHDYYGPWFQKTDPNVHDFIYEGTDIIAGPCSAISGPVDEFGPVGWDEAKGGGTFIKIGIGALRKPDEKKYDNYRLYEIADPGKWTVRKRSDSVEFTQKLTDSASGYGYVYRKVLKLAKGKPEMVLEHTLKNTGKKEIRTTVYNHNFLVLDQRSPGEGVVITVPFRIQPRRPPEKELAEILENRIAYRKTLTGRDVVAFPVQGFGDSARDNEIRIEDSRAGAGMRVVADRPLLRMYLWSIRSVISVEPFISVDITPGGEFAWKGTYTYYTLPEGAK